eukprot:1493414-Alexandrium_andersonii.AAC.1
MSAPASWSLRRSTAATAVLPDRKPGRCDKSRRSLGAKWMWARFSFPTLYFASRPSRRMLGTKFTFVPWSP